MADVGGSGEDRGGMGIPAPIFQRFNSKGWGRDTYAGECGKEQGFLGSRCPTRDKFVDPDHREQRQAARGEPDLPWSPGAVLVDTVARLEWDMNDMRAESRYLRTPGGSGFFMPTQTDDIHVY